ASRRIPCRVARVTPQVEFAWTFHEISPVLYGGEHVFRMESTGPDTVRFIDREVFHGLLLPFRTAGIRARGKRGMALMGDALRTRVERR
ncbi:MAG: hypothetical protein KDB60_15175, partial [Propionibacteriaceae bacterium]|nr:hypothetical protein [Propionibacteriaceae bacterium]